MTRIVVGVVGIFPGDVNGAVCHWKLLLLPFASELSLSMCLGGSGSHMQLIRIFTTSDRYHSLKSRVKFR